MIDPSSVRSHFRPGPEHDLLRADPAVCAEALDRMREYLVTMNATAAPSPRAAPRRLRGRRALSRRRPPGGRATYAASKLVRDGDDNYRITGEKLWISNSTVADYVVLVAATADQEFTMLLVDREEHGSERSRMRSLVSTGGGCGRSSLRTSCPLRPISWVSWAAVCARP